MFSKEEAKKIRQEFWTTFGKQYPRKWLLYHTKVKEITLKFTFTTKKALVSIDIEAIDPLIQAYYFDKLVSLKQILTTEVDDCIFDPQYELENGKCISRIYVEKSNVSIHNKKTWPATMQFLHDYMDSFETFFITYKDFITA